MIFRFFVASQQQFNFFRFILPGVFHITLGEVLSESHNTRTNLNRSAGSNLEPPQSENSAVVVSLSIPFSEYAWVSGGQILAALPPQQSLNSSNQDNRHQG